MKRESLGAEIECVSESERERDIYIECVSENEIERERERE